MGRKTLKFLVQLLCGILIFFAFFSISVFYGKCKREKIKNYKGTAVCEVVERGGNTKGSYIIVQYYVNSKMYELKATTYFSARDFIQPNEKYLINYSEQDPSLAEVNFEIPLFTKDEKIDSTMGQITRVTDRNVCMFDYSVKSINYQRFQKIPDTCKINMGTRFKVIYIIDNPKRAILFFK